MKKTLNYAAISIFFLVSVFLISEPPLANGGCIVSTMPGSVIRNASFDFYVSPKNPILTDRGIEIEICVKRGDPPYDWATDAGSGFTFAESETTELCNTLIVDSTACGSNINITDFKDRIAESVIRYIGGGFQGCYSTPYNGVCYGENYVIRREVRNYNVRVRCCADRGSECKTQDDPDCMGPVTVCASEICGDLFLYKFRNISEWKCE